MTDSSAAFISAEQAFGDRAETSVKLILSPIPLLAPLLQSLLDPISYLFGALLGSLSGAKISTHILNSLPNNTLKNAYVAGTVGFYLIVNFLGHLLPIPLLLPVLILLGVVNAGVAAFLGAVFGILADLLGGGKS